jgi:hypothetical protein
MENDVAMLFSGTPGTVMYVMVVLVLDDSNSPAVSLDR